MLIPGSGAVDQADRCDSLLQGRTDVAPWLLAGRAATQTLPLGEKGLKYELIPL